MSKAIIVINDKHVLMDDQIRVLNETFDSFEIHRIPSSGYDLKHMKLTATKVTNDEVAVVFATPILPLVRLVASITPNWFVLYTDDRRERISSNGKPYQAIGNTGWKLI